MAIPFSDKKQIESSNEKNNFNFLFWTAIFDVNFVQYAQVLRGIVSSELRSRKENAPNHLAYFCR